MNSKSKVLWFDGRVLCLLIAIFIQNVTSFWGRWNLLCLKTFADFHVKILAHIERVYTRLEVSSENIQLHNNAHDFY